MTEDKNCCNCLKIMVGKRTIAKKCIHCAGHLCINCKDQNTCRKAKVSESQRPQKKEAKHREENEVLRGIHKEYSPFWENLGERVGIFLDLVIMCSNEVWRKVIRSKPNRLKIDHETYRLLQKLMKQWKKEKGSYHPQFKMDIDYTVPQIRKIQGLHVDVCNVNYYYIGAFYIEQHKGTGHKITDISHELIAKKEETPNLLSDLSELFSKTCYLFKDALKSEYEIKKPEGYKNADEYAREKVGPLFYNWLETVKKHEGFNLWSEGVKNPDEKKDVMFSEKIIDLRNKIGDEMFKDWETLMYKSALLKNAFDIHLIHGVSIEKVMMATLIWQEKIIQSQLNWAIKHRLEGVPAPDNTDFPNYFKEKENVEKNRTSDNN